ncbi:MAG TPA: MBL fold metallo-hydrolase [Pyrinomonadaceae bacterium]|jgi:L-ascorbate metabolism protein UlaG (beta-lactamase superfamily)|nr:MBL fold metallo-hydrolase [Pyrinomonadaceae bacterium]
MSVSVKDLRTYTSFARRFAGKFVRDRIEERRVPIAPAPHRPRPEEWGDERLTAAWLGHATVLINFYGTWLLTDPALRARVGVRVGVTTLGPRRVVLPALSARELPRLDAVLVSHAHMDHTDLATLRRLPRRARAVVQKGNGDLVRRFARVDELAWGESVEVKGARVESLEVSHWGARRLTDRHRGYGGFLVEKNGRALVFGGDTAYTSAFARLRRRGTRVDLAVLPIGGYDPYINVHANPEQSWRMAQEMGAEFILPMHHSTFRLSREPVDEPRRRLLAAAGPERRRVALTEVGETWTLPE